MIKIAVLTALIAAPAMALAQADKTADSTEKVRCKRQVETGSLAKVTKVCKTEKQWRALRDASKDETRQMMEAVSSTRTSG